MEQDSIPAVASLPLKATLSGALYQPFAFGPRPGVAMTCGAVECRPGTHIALDQGDDFGPFAAGPDGVELYEVMMGDPRSFPARQDEWRALLAERDVQPLPNPPIVLPGGLADTRN